MTLLSDIPEFFRGDSEVPDSAFIQPGQSYVKNVEYTVATLYIMQYGPTNLGLNGQGITEFRILETPLYDGVSILSNSTINLSGNRMGDLAVQKFIDDIWELVVNVSGADSCIFDLRGPEMGTPLTGGTVGGWSLEIMPSYVLGSDYFFNINAGPYYQHLIRIILFDSATFFNDSADYPDSNMTVIGVNDHPSKTQMLEKLRDFRVAVNPFGSYSIVGDKLTYTDEVPRGWSLDATGDMVSTNSGMDASNNHMSDLVALGNTVSFMASDGITEVTLP